MGKRSNGEMVGDTSSSGKERREVKEKSQKENKAYKEKTARKEVKEHKGKKAKATKEAAVVKTGDTGMFSLFGGKNDSALDDVFNKGAAFARPVNTVVVPPSVASSSKVIEPTKTESSASNKTVKKSTMPSKGISQPTSSVRNHEEEDLEESASDKDDESDADGDHEEAEAEDQDEDEDEEDEGIDPSTLVHESIQPGPSKRNSSVTKKYVPPNETPQDRDRRTVFVGNLPIEVAKSKSSLSQLRAHILTFTPTAKIESARIRSIPFATPTAALPTEGDDDDATSRKRAKREKERAAAWRSVQDVLEYGDKREKEEVDTSKTFIDAKGKRKVAFIKKDFHNDAASCNSYVVFAHPHPDRPSNLPPILDPYTAATQALSANASSFLSRTIRVDSLHPKNNPSTTSANLFTPSNTSTTPRDIWTAGTDPKKSLFVGGLDYATKDEDLRVFFEEKVKAERGARSGGEKWVTGVRVVRDKETQMGKGFGYIHFVDRESVDEILAMDITTLRFAKRPLRVQRCKTLPSSIIKSTKTHPSTSTSTAKSPSFKSKSTSKPNAYGQPTTHKSLSKAMPTTIPKGDPSLGDKLRGLSKDERKVAKSSDADRQARRFAKKKLRGRMDKEDKGGAVKLTATKSERERGKKAKMVGASKKGKKRSERAVAKMKGSRVL